MKIWSVSPAGYVLDAIIRAEKRGHRLDDFLDGLGLERDTFIDPGAYITRQAYYQIVEHLIVDLGVPDIGFAQPENEHLLGIGVAGLAVLTAPTLGAALEATLRFQNVLAVPTRMHLERRNGEAHLVFNKLESDETRAWLLQWAVETSASSLALFLKNSPQQLQSARFSYAAPDNTQTYQDAFGCELLFSQPRSELVFPEELLAMPLTTHNPLAHEVAVRQCELSERKSRSNGTLIEQIEGMLLSNATFPLTLPQVANQLGLSARTLQRRLDVEQTSFRLVALRTRFRLAVELLNTDLPIKEIAFFTGYSDTANFSAAFKKQANVSPASFRALKKQGGQSKVPEERRGQSKVPE